VADWLAQITNRVLDPHPLPESERPTRLRTVVAVVGPFVVLAAIITIFAVTS
jgi:hypothetical protein